MSQCVAPFRGRTSCGKKWSVAELTAPLHNGQYPIADSPFKPFKRLRSKRIRAHPCFSAAIFFVHFVFLGGHCPPRSNEWCFFGKKRDGFRISLIYPDFKVVESRNVLIGPAGITAIFHDPES
jgi:hypothetical protein